MKRKNTIASDSEADSDTEVPKGSPFISYTMHIFISLSIFKCHVLPNMHEENPECMTHRSVMCTLSVLRVVQRGETACAASVEEEPASLCIVKSGSII
jgi:hypothetical protein